MQPLFLIQSCSFLKIRQNVCLCFNIITVYVVTKSQGVICNVLPSWFFPGSCRTESRCPRVHPYLVRSLFIRQRWMWRRTPGCNKNKKNGIFMYIKEDAICLNFPPLPLRGLLPDRWFFPEGIFSTALIQFFYSGLSFRNPLLMEQWTIVFINIKI